ncbi:D-alanyl-D-alanine carboxypeptidase/D-alanyl-D-alanine-endopeptidase [Paucibacter sp. TC2R-5]|uniref:D-alanyl-D-alanine carboxypeptidase/D-alanyl-D-alanine endopeptidase n=1 Tax=Paucibacter sp. TC2R-5 TaxID=2893555 RepID=UPI0021E3663D|nr:D-alanyl-D-alanine carboxypeptidase/D-alanyl-D-alanine-endopeptidase [Paucibacter sp. TC2R-5]MCV2360256.1 D-alanyl-D-alanine carboxypeptidase/D-alanyl-D-alanine-endopeptidase [Paucibacter sp. TC2R-5]
MPLNNKAEFRRMAQVLSLAVLSLALGGCAGMRAAPTLPAEVTQAMAEAGVAQATLGVVAYPLHHRTRALQLNAELAMQPASTMKIVTTLVALDRLGPNARGRTDLLAAAPLVGDVLQGPLYLRGGADTDLDWGALQMLLRELREQGVREIQGGLVVDRSLFRPARLDIGLAPFDEAPEFAYNAVPDALNLGGAVLSFRLSADAATLRARVSPAWPGIELDTSAMTLNDKPCKDWDEDWLTPQVSSTSQGQRIQLGGAFPRNCRQTTELNLLDRQWLTAQALRQMWRELGGVMGGAVELDREAVTPSDARLLASHQGRPLAEVLRGMMKRSDNLLTRLTYLRLGAAAAQPGEVTRVAAERAVRDWFAAKGLDSAGLVLDNGSGLSRSERIKPAQLAAVLAQAWDSPHAPELLTTLPVAGVDGTLSRRFKGAPAEGRARMKTGTLNEAVALAGYVRDAQERPWVVVVMLNGPDTGAKGRPVLDALVNWVARQND